MLVFSGASTTTNFLKSSISPLSLLIETFISFSFPQTKERNVDYTIKQLGLNNEDERINLSNEKDCLEYKKILSEQLSLYFNKFSIPKFDLWKGGSAKSNVSNPSFWKKAWGSNWNTTF